MGRIVALLLGGLIGASLLLHLSAAQDESLGLLDDFLNLPE